MKKNLLKFLNYKSNILVAVLIIFSVSFSGCTFYQEMVQTGQLQSQQSEDTENLEQQTVEPTTVHSPVMTAETGVWSFLEGFSAVSAVSDTTSNVKWYENAYDDSGWARGVGSFGANEGVQAELSGGYYPSTLLDQQDVSNNNYPVYLLRSEFNLGSLDGIGSLVANIVYDDAVIVYMNEEVVFEGNVPAGGYPTATSFGAAEPSSVPHTDQFEIPLYKLVLGKNVMAVELRQGDEYSSDIYFEMSSLVPTSDGIQSVNIGVAKQESSVNLTFNASGVAAVNSYIEVIKTTGINAQPKVYNVERYEEANNGYTYRTELTDLEPNTQYSYTIFCNGNQANGVFSTGSTQDGVSVLLLGSPMYGAGENTKDEQNGLMDDTILEYKGNADFLSVVGGIAENSNDINSYIMAFETLRDSHLPSNIVFGQTDMGSTIVSDNININDISPELDNSSSGAMSGDYWFSFGDTLFIVLNTNHGSLDVRATFVAQAVLQHSEIYGEPSFKVLMLNHSLMPNNTSLTDQQRLEVENVRAELSPTIASNDIDFAISSFGEGYNTGSFGLYENGLIRTLGEKENIQKTTGETVYANIASVTGGVEINQDTTTLEYAVDDAKQFYPMVSKLDIVENTATLTTWNTETKQVVSQITLTK